MAKKKYIPNRGDFVQLNLNPRSGSEQSGWRPALILSPVSYNSASGLAIACPITSKIKGYPFEVVIHGDNDITGAVLADQIRCLDWRARKARYVSKAPNDLLMDVIAKISVLIDP